MTGTTGHHGPVKNRGRADTSLPEDPVAMRLKTYFDRHPTTPNVFARHGKESAFAAEIAALRALGWSERDPQETAAPAACLLIDLSGCDASELDAILASAPDAGFIAIHLAAGRKKTPFLAGLEGRGFRILGERGEVTYLSGAVPEEEILAADLRLDAPGIRTALQRSWRRIRNLPEATEVTLVSAPAPNLLQPERFDIAVKAHYARLWKQECARAWREYAYFEQARRVTGPGPDVSEHDGTGKSGIAQFQAEFHSLLRTLDPGDVPVVPIDAVSRAFDGAHRIAAAIVMNRRVHAARIEAPSACLASAGFLAGRSHGHPPCPEEILDEAAIEYCRVKRGLVLALVFPTVASESYAIECLTGAGRIVYRKDIVLSPAAGAGLMRQVYLGHAWAGVGDEDAGFTHKVRSCFPFRGTLRAVLLDGCDPRELRPVKDRIRSHYGVGNHSIHFTDGDDEVLRIARALFNTNSVELLRLGTGSLPGFHQKMFAYRDWLERNGLDEEAFCIDGGAVLALLGLRECRDIDFLFHGNPGALPATPEHVDCHNDLARYHHQSIADVVGDPRLHCWYMGVKFCTPRLVAAMKRRRGEPKDRADVALLETRLIPGKPAWLTALRLLASRMEGYLRARAAGAVECLKKPLRPIVRAWRGRRR